MKVGMVVLLGRPNAGKSTLLNNILGQKISIMSPLPQTTRLSIYGFYHDKRGQIVLVDTPGVFKKVKDEVGAKINLLGEKEARRADVVVYLIDHTRRPGEEERKILRVVETLKKPRILAINKIDLEKPSYEEEYTEWKTSCEAVVRISALRRTNLNRLLDKIFEFLPEGEPLLDPKQLRSPALNLDARTFIAELIREKVFLLMRQEVPYTVMVEVDELEEKEEVFYIRATIYTFADRYKKMIIGKGGETIKRIGIKARRELETICGKKVFLQLTVKTDPRWPERWGV